MGVGRLPSPTAPSAVTGPVWRCSNSLAWVAASTARGILEISNSTISGNTASSGDGTGSGGGIVSGGSGTLTISSSTISGNLANKDGGGILNNSPFTIIHSTISDNRANLDGGGIINYATLEIGHTTMKAGVSGANIFNNGGTVTSLGYNLSSDDGSGFLTASGDQINTDPMLGPLQDNGGPTFTHELLTGSPALEAGDPNFTPRLCPINAGILASLTAGSISGHWRCNQRPHLAPLRLPRPPHSHGNGDSNSYCDAKRDGQSHWHSLADSDGHADSQPHAIAEPGPGAEYLDPAAG